MAVDRVEKFCVDGGVLLEKGVAFKILPELANLRKWLQKHQSEIITPNAQAKLLALVERYYSFTPTQDAEAYTEAVFGLVSDLLTLPEGKLISSKSKKKVLSWYDALTPSKGTPGKVVVAQEWQVVDISDTGKLTLMNPDSNDEILEDFELKTDLASKIQDKFSSGGDVRIWIKAGTQDVTKWVCDEEPQDK